jgi:hypothetical protein
MLLGILFPDKTESEPKQLEKARGAAASHVLRAF